MNELTFADPPALRALLLRRYRRAMRLAAACARSMVFPCAMASAALLPSAQAQTVTNGPYYATPSWDQTLPASARFLVLSNFNSDAVLDRETGLVWQRAPFATRLTYLFANNVCGVQTTGNRAGWRLPSSAELSTLFDPSSTSVDGLPAGHPFIDVGSRPDLYWSITPNASGRAGAGTRAAGTAYQVVLYAFLPETTQFRIWCVRGNAGAAGG